MSDDIWLLRQDKKIYTAIQNHKATGKMPVEAVELIEGAVQGSHFWRLELLHRENITSEEKFFDWVVTYALKENKERVLIWALQEQEKNKSFQSLLTRALKTTIFNNPSLWEELVCLYTNKLTKEQKQHSLSAAQDKKCFKAVKHLLKDGVEIKATELEKGFQAYLHQSKEKYTYDSNHKDPDYELIQMYLDRGVNPSCELKRPQGDWVRAPIYYAYDMGDSKLTQMLLKKSADVEYFLKHIQYRKDQTEISCPEMLGTMELVPGMKMNAKQIYRHTIKSDIDRRVHSRRGLIYQAIEIEGKNLERRKGQCKNTVRTRFNISAVKDLGDLRKPYKGSTGLIRLVRAGKFNRVVKWLKESDQKLELKDLTSKDPDTGANVIEILGYKKQLDLLFDPELWVGDVTGMKSLWESEHIPAKFKSQVLDIQDRYKRVQKLTEMKTVKETLRPPGKKAFILKRR
jgi:hypothetical protein